MSGADLGFARLFTGTADVPMPAHLDPEVLQRIVSHLVARRPADLVVLVDEFRDATEMAAEVARSLAALPDGHPRASTPVLLIPISSTGGLAPEQVIDRVEGDAIIVLQFTGEDADAEWESRMRSLTREHGLPVVRLHRHGQRPSTADDLESLLMGAMEQRMEPSDLVIDAGCAGDPERLLARLRRTAEALSQYHGVTFTPEAVDRAACLRTFRGSPSQPALGETHLDLAAAQAASSGRRTVIAEDIDPDPGRQARKHHAAEVAATEPLDPQRLREHLREWVQGQDHAVEAAARLCLVGRRGLWARRDRPAGPILLLAGPTGTGKTTLALAMADALGVPHIRIDLGASGESHVISQHLGAPPGYVGSEPSPEWLTSRFEAKPNALLIVDEIDKAHPEVQAALMLQPLGHGRLTDRAGRTISLRECSGVVLTANWGSEAYQRRPAGFNNAEAQQLTAEAEVRAAITRSLAPELLNRVDEIIVFQPFTGKRMQTLARHALASYQSSVRTFGYDIDYDETVIDTIARHGCSAEHGARYLQRTIETLIAAPLALQGPGRYALAARSDGITIIEAGP